MDDGYIGDRYNYFPPLLCIFENMNNIKVRTYKRSGQDGYQDVGFRIQLPLFKFGSTTC